MTFRIDKDTDEKIERLRHELIQKQAMRSLFGGSFKPATRSRVVEQGITEYFFRKLHEHQNPDTCGYCKQTLNIQKQYNELDTLYIDLKDLYKSMKSGEHGQKAQKDNQEKENL